LKGEILLRYFRIVVGGISVFLVITANIFLRAPVIQTQKLGGNSSDSSSPQRWKFADNLRGSDSINILIYESLASASASNSHRLTIAVRWPFSRPAEWPTSINPRHSVPGPGPPLPTTQSLRSRL